MGSPASPVTPPGRRKGAAVEIPSPGGPDVSGWRTLAEPITYWLDRAIDRGAAPSQVQIARNNLAALLAACTQLEQAEENYAAMAVREKLRRETLEKERDEALKQLDNYKANMTTAWEAAVTAGQAAEKDRDEARWALDARGVELDVILQGREAAEKERDDALAVIAVWVTRAEAAEARVAELETALEQVDALADEVLGRDLTDPFWPGLTESDWEKDAKALALAIRAALTTTTAEDKT